MGISCFAELRWKMNENRNNWNPSEAIRRFFFQLKSVSWQPYPCPVAEGQHQGDNSGFQSRQRCQVVGGETSNVITCTHFTQQAAARTQKWEKSTMKGRIKFLNWHRTERQSKCWKGSLRDKIWSMFLLLNQGYMKDTTMHWKLYLKIEYIFDTENPVMLHPREDILRWLKNACFLSDQARDEIWFVYLWLT